MNNEKAIKIALLLKKNKLINNKKPPVNGTASFDVKSLCGNTFLSSKKLYFVKKKLSVVRNAIDKPIVNKDFINNILY